MWILIIINFIHFINIIIHFTNIIIYSIEIIIHFINIIVNSVLIFNYFINILINFVAIFFNFLHILIFFSDNKFFYEREWSWTGLFLAYWGWLFCDRIDFIDNFMLFFVFFDELFDLFFEFFLNFDDKVCKLIGSKIFFVDLILKMF